MSAPKWAVGMQKIGPGIYADKTAAIHLDEAELCEHMRVPCTPENAEVLRRAAIEAVRRVWGKAAPPITCVDDEE